MLDCTKRLEYILDSVNDWLRFAEAKNGTLLALNSVFSFGMVRIIFTSHFEGVFFYCLMACATLLLLSALGCLLSFLPKLSLGLPRRGASPMRIQNVNSIYFGNIAKLGNSDDYLQHLLDCKIVEDDIKNDFFALDLVKQTFINSKIATTKYGYFVIAVTLTATSLLLVLVLMYLWVLDKALLHGLFPGAILAGSIF